MPTPKAPTSKLDLQRAETHLKATYKWLKLYQDTTTRPAQAELRLAMEILGMEVPK